MNIYLHVFINHVNMLLNSIYINIIPILFGSNEKLLMILKACFLLLKTYSYYKILSIKSNLNLLLLGRNVDSCYKLVI